MLLVSASCALSIACFGSGTRPAPDTPPIRSASSIAEQVGEATRSVQRAEPDLVRYGSSLEQSDQGSSTSEQDEQANAQGRITIYAKPKGQIMIDGELQGQSTPATLDVPAGKHEVQVEYEQGEISEIKTVRVRQGSRIKLFFRRPVATDEAPAEAPFEEPIEAPDARSPETPSTPPPRGDEGSP